MSFIFWVILTGTNYRIVGFLFGFSIASSFAAYHLLDEYKQASATLQASVEELQISTEKVPFIILKLYDHDSLLRMRISFRCLHMSVESRRLKKT